MVHRFEASAATGGKGPLAGFMHIELRDLLVHQNVVEHTGNFDAQLAPTGRLAVLKRPIGQIDGVF